MARKIVLILGLFVALLPYLGFPEALDNVLYTIAGLLISFLAWSGKRPAPISSIEEMEGELHQAMEEEHDPQKPETQRSIQSRPESLPEKMEDRAISTTEVEMISTDKMVSVAFAKHRSRNLKKRITQDDSSPQV